MGATVGGSIIEASLRGRIFAVAADADGARNLGGYTNEVQSNGDASGRKIMTLVPWTIGGLTLSIDDTRGDQEFLQNIADDTDWVTITVTLASGYTYRGQGTIADNIEFSTQNATAGVTLTGPEKLERQ